MLFRRRRSPSEKAEVIDEIDTIRRQLNLPGLREWPGLPWRAIHDRILQASKNPALGNVLIENAGGGEDDEPRVENPDAWSAAPGYHAALSFVLQVADAPTFAIDEGTIRALHYMMAGHDPRMRRAAGGEAPYRSGRIPPARPCTKLLTPNSFRR